jgi:hypothetical protein
MVAGFVGGDELDGYFAAKAFVFSGVDFAHSAGA